MRGDGQRSAKSSRVDTRETRQSKKERTWKVKESEITSQILSASFADKEPRFQFNQRGR